MTADCSSGLREALQVPLIDVNQGKQDLFLSLSSKGHTVVFVYIYALFL